jgi:hypothetical protein
MAKVEVLVEESDVRFNISGFDPGERYSFHAEYYDADGTTLSEVSGGNNKAKPDGTARFVTPRFDGGNGGGELHRVHAKVNDIDEGEADVSV